MRQKLFSCIALIALVFSLPGFSAFAQSNDLRSRAQLSREAFIPQFSATDFNLDKPHTPGELIIKFAQGSDPEVIRATLDSLGTTTDTPNTTRGMLVSIDMDRFRNMRAMRSLNEQRTDSTVSIDDEILTEILNVAMLKPEVEYIEPNFYAQAFAAPNDPYYPYQWSFPTIGAETAWNHTTGEGSVVAVVDTGVAYEESFIFSLAQDFAQTTFVPGYDFINNDAQPHDDNGHGSHVAGTIAASTNDGYGAAGIAHAASLMPIKVLDKNGSGSYMAIANGIRYAADNGADVINLSLGGPAESQLLFDAVRYAHEKGSLVVAATGNDGSNTVMYPAAYNDFVLAVGSVGYDKNKAPYSTYGAALDIVAPGGDTSVDRNSDGYPDGILQETLKQRKWGGAYTNKTSFYFYQGTSMAAPHVAGVAALINSLGITSPSTIRDILVRSAEDVHSPGWDALSGWGMVRADKAVQQALQHTGDATQQAEPESETPIESQTEELEPESPQEESADEPTEPEQPEEPQEQQMSLDTTTHNAWGRAATRFSTLWQDAYLFISTEDGQQEPLPGAKLDVQIFDEADELVAQGTATTDDDGEVLLKLGNFARGTYTVVTKAVKDGFESALDTITFMFR